MSLFKRIVNHTSKDAAQTVGTLLGNDATRSAQNATDAAVDGMSLFRWKVSTPIIQNGSFDTQKGNLFEYIEAAKFNVDAASKGKGLTAFVTDTEDPHAAADIVIRNDNEVVREVQAKFSDSKHAAADTVTMQRRDKYKGMQRLIRKEDHYIDEVTGKETTLLKKAKQIAKDRSEIDGNIYQAQYKDTYENLTDELHYDNVSSGGTTIDELRKAYDSPNSYAREFEHKQVAAEMKCSATNMAKASFVTTGIVSGVSNMFMVFQDKKELSEALADVGADAVKSSIRGGAFFQAEDGIRDQGIKKGSALLSDSTAATVMAGGIIDGGVALYSYACGEIDADELRNQIVDTTAKAATTIYFTKAVAAVLGKSVNPFVPMAIYTTASYVVTCTREILKNAKLNAAEYERMAAILQESTRQMDEYHDEFKKYVAKCEEKQRRMFDKFIDSFEYNLETGENYDEAVFSIVKFADEAGIALQHVDFVDFQKAMRSKETFVLG